MDEGPFLPVQCEGEFLYGSLVVEVGLMNLKILKKSEMPSGHYLIVICRDLAQLMGLCSRFSLVNPAKVKACRSFMIT